MKYLSDTSPEAARVLAQINRNVSSARKWAMIEEARRTAFQLHRTGYRDRHPNATERDVWRDWIRKTIGPSYEFIAERIDPVEATRMQHLPVVQEVMNYLTQLGVARVLGGSFASSIHGDDRSTKDADISAAPFPGREAEFASLLGDRYYYSVDAIKEANRNRSMFNVIHFATGFKVDVFIQKARPYDKNLTDRRVPRRFGNDQSIELDVVTAEDVILLKLEWYRMGGEISEQQWKDILGVIRTQGKSLDNAYLDHWAADLGVADLLARVRQDV